MKAKLGLEERYIETESVIIVKDNVIYRITEEKEGLGIMKIAPSLNDPLAEGAIFIIPNSTNYVSYTQIQ